MPHVDRAALLHHLSELGAEDDAAALAAARAAHTLVAEAGVTWDDLLADAEPVPDVEPDLDDADDEAAVAEPEDDDFDAGAKISAADAAAAKAIIEELLARKNLFEGTRDELKDYQQDLAAGDLHPADVSYLRALKKRLSK